MAITDINIFNNIEGEINKKMYIRVHVVAARENASREVIGTRWSSDNSSLEIEKKNTFLRDRVKSHSLRLFWLFHPCKRYKIPNTSKQ